MELNGELSGIDWVEKLSEGRADEMEFFVEERNEIQRRRGLGPSHNPSL